MMMMMRAPPNRCSANASLVQHYACKEPAVDFELRRGEQIILLVGLSISTRAAQVAFLCPLSNSFTEKLPENSMSLPKQDRKLDECLWIERGTGEILGGCDLWEELVIDALVR